MKGNVVMDNDDPSESADSSFPTSQQDPKKDSEEGPTPAVKAENMIRGNDLEELKAMHERSLENKRKKEAEKRRKEEEEQKRQEQERLEHMWHNEEVSCLARTFLLFALVTADELTFAPLVHLCG